MDIKELSLLIAIKRGGISHTTKEKYERRKVSHKNIYIVAKGDLKRNIGNYYLYLWRLGLRYS